MKLNLTTQSLLPSLKSRHLQAELFDGNQSKLILTYDIPLKAARLESSNGTKRVFMMYHEGKRLPRVVLKNEYGFDVGAINLHANEDNKMMVVIYDNTFYCNADFLDINNIIIENANGSVLLQANFTNQQKTEEDFSYSIICGMCWYASLPLAMSPAAAVMNGFTNNYNLSKNIIAS